MIFGLTLDRELTPQPILTLSKKMATQLQMMKIPDGLDNGTIDDVAHICLPVDNCRITVTDEDNEALIMMIPKR